MRIIAGEFKGRRLTEPKDPRVRPTTDRVREAWFSILGPRLRGARVLDLFAGSGALGLEALSRGAKHVTFVELGDRSLAALRTNIRALDVADRTTVYRGDALRYVSGAPEMTFDIALADPPYDTDQGERLAAQFGTRPFAALLAIEHRATTAMDGDDTRAYGDIAVTFFEAP